MMRIEVTLLVDFDDEELAEKGIDTVPVAWAEHMTNEIVQAAQGVAARHDGLEISLDDWREW